jgi:hypothetical protein
VAKYLAKKLHLAPGQAFQLTKKGQAGRLLYHMLRNPQQDRQYATVASYPQQFLVNVSPQLSWLNGCRHLTDQCVHDFNRQVEDMIEEEFITTLQTLANLGIEFEKKEQSLRFQRMYDLTEDDMTLDALIKCYYRFRKAEEEAQKRANLIPNCPAVAMAA